MTFFTFDPKGYRYSSEETTRVLDPYHVHVVIDRLAAVREAVGPDVDIIMEKSFLYRCAGRSATGRAGEKI
mgnify:CR=1 FL=1